MAVGRSKKRRRSKVNGSSDTEWSGADGEDLPNVSEQRTRRILTRTADDTTSKGDGEFSEELSRTVSEPSVRVENGNGKKIKKGRGSRVSRANPSSDSEWSGADREDFPKESEQRTRSILTRKAVHFDDTVSKGDGEFPQEFTRTASAPSAIVENGYGKRIKKRRRSRANHTSDGEWSGASEENPENEKKQRTERILTRRLAGDEGPSRRMTGSASFLEIDARVRDDSDGAGGVGEGLLDDKKDMEMLSNDQNTIEGAAVCGICLSEGIDPLDRGKLDCCEHFFCFVCIMEWAKVESRCPLCKQRFVTIIKPPRADIPRSRGRTVRIPTRNQVYEPPEEEAPIDNYSNTVCMECQESGNEYLLLLCDGCDSAAHTYCVGLGRSVPRGDWYCSSCTSVFVDDASTGSDDDDFESELPEQLLSDISALAEASTNVIRRTRRTRRVGLTPRPRRQRSGRRRRRRSVQRGARRNRRVGIRPPPSRLLSSSSANARTLTQQRRLQDRINHMRRNWNNIRSGSAGFSGTLRSSVNNSGPTLLASPSSSVKNISHPHDEAVLINPSEACQGNTSKASPKQDTLKSDIEKAWRKLEEARALRDISGSATQSKSTESHGHQDSRLVKDNQVSPDHVSEDYQQGTSFRDLESKRRMMDDISVRDELSNGSTLKDIKVKSRYAYPSDAAKLYQAHKAGEAEGFTCKIDLKGKAPMPPSFEETSQGRHHEKYEGQAVNYCRGTLEGTSRDAEECEESVLSSMRQDNILSHFQESDHGGMLTGGHCYELNGTKGFYKVDGCLQDQSVERYNPIAWNQTFLQDGRRVSPTEVGVCGTAAMRHDDHNIQFEIERDLKLEHLKKYFPNSSKEPQCNMVSEVKSNPSFTGFLNHVKSEGPLDSPNPLPMKYQDSRSDGMLHHKRSEKIKLDCLLSLSTNVIKMNQEHRTRSERALKPGNVVKGSREDLPQREAVKDRVLKIISQNLKPLLKSHKIGKDKYKEMARSTTHHLLAACGLEHNRRLVRSVEVLSCSHVSSDTVDKVLDRFCDECLKLQVTKVLEALINQTEAPSVGNSM